MKKIFLSTIALSFLAAPVLTSYEASAQTPAQARQELREDRRELRQDRREVRQDRREVRRDQRQAARPAWLKRGGRYNKGGQYVGDHRRYGLRAPARGQRWVRYNNDYVLVSIASGLIVSLILSR